MTKAEEILRKEIDKINMEELREQLLEIRKTTDKFYDHCKIELGAYTTLYDKITKAITYTRSGETLEVKFTIPVYFWLNTTYTKKGDKYMHNLSEDIYSLDELLIYYDKKISKL